MPESENLYIIDSSSLIEIQRRYPHDIFPSVWKHLHDLAMEGRLVAPIEVKKELLEGYDSLKGWIHNHEEIFREFDQDLIIKTQKILGRFPRMADSESEKLYNADPFIIALALQMQENPQRPLISYVITVVTDEKGKLASNPKLHEHNMKKIPDVCEKYGIACSDHFGMFRKEGWMF
jgi:hypothetical protein